MVTRLDNAVTLTHEQADRISHILSDYASQQFAHAQRTRSAVVRDTCDRGGNEARELADMMVTAMYTWQSA